MNKVLFSIVACLPLLLAAGNAAYHGSLLAALEEKKPRIRAGMIVRALETAHPETGSRNAVNLLNQAFDSGAFDRTLLMRLFILLEKTPGDYPLAEFCNTLAETHKFFPPEYFSAVNKAIRHIDRKNLSPEDNYRYNSFIDNFCQQLFRHGKNAECGELFDLLLKKNRDNPDTLIVLAGIAAAGDFRVNAVLPGRENAGDVSTWNRRKQMIAAAITSFAPDNFSDALTIINAAREIRLKQTPEMLKSFCRQFPSQHWEYTVAAVARTFQRKDLLPARPEPSVWNFIQLCELREFRAAKRMMKKLDPDLEPSLLAVMHYERSEFAEIIKMLDSKILHMNNMEDFAFFSVLSSIQYARNSRWADVMITRVYTTYQAEPEKVPPQLRNAAGYVAADLNTSLDKAEKLIAAALKYDPDNPSYLDSMAWLSFRRKNFTEAEKLINRAIANEEPDESSSVLCFHAAEIKLAAGKKAEAVKLFQRGKRCYLPGSKACRDYTPEQITALEKLLK